MIDIFRNFIFTGKGISICTCALVSVCMFLPLVDSFYFCARASKQNNSEGFLLLILGIDAERRNNALLLASPPPLSRQPITITIVTTYWVVSIWATQRVQLTLPFSLAPLSHLVSSRQENTVCSSFFLSTTPHHVWIT